MEQNTFLRPKTNARREKRETYRDADPGVGGGRPPRTISESSNLSKGYYKGFNAKKQRKGAKAKLSLARRARMTTPLRYPKNSASKLSATYETEVFVAKNVEASQVRPVTKLPGIGSNSTVQRRPKTTPARLSRSHEVRPPATKVRPPATITPESAKDDDKKERKKKKKIRKKKIGASRKNNPAEILQQQLEKVCHGRYVSIRGSLKLGSNKIKIAIQDVTSGATYKTSFQLDEDSTQTAQDDKAQGNRILRVVVVACDLVPNRDKSGMRKKKAWTVEIDPDQLQAALEINHEMDEQVHQQQTSSTRRAATASRDRRARECSDQDPESNEFDYFNDKACPPFKPQTQKKNEKLENHTNQRQLSRKVDMAMDAPPFRARIDDIVFQCVRELDYRPMQILVAYRPEDGSITLQAHDHSIDHYWRLVVRTRAADEAPSADDGLNNREIKEQLQALEGLVDMLDITGTSDYSLGKLELIMDDKSDDV